MKIYRNSLNLFATTWEEGSINYNSGTDEESTTYMRTVNYIPIVYNQTYSISRSIDTGLIGLRFYDSAHNYLGSGTPSRVQLISGTSASSPMGAETPYCCFRIIDDTVAYMRLIDASYDTSSLYMMIAGEIAEAAMPAYEPYNVVDWYGYKYKLRASGAWSELDDKKAPWGESNAKVLRRKRTAKSKA